MSEGWSLPAATRSRLLPEADRLTRLAELEPQLLAMLDGETDEVAAMATVANGLWSALPQSNWCGFYRRIDGRTLAVGPYHGGLGCLRIDFDRGVCGACARTATVQLVPDVHAFPGHIACDDSTRSELVVPVFDGEGRVRAVLDLDSPHLAGFSPAEADALQALLARAFAGVVWSSGLG